MYTKTKSKKVKNEQRLLYRVIQNFEGMQKIDVFDALQKIEVLLFYASSPLNAKDIKQIILSDIEKVDEIDPFHFTFLPNGNLCEFVESNEWLQIYKENNRFLPDWEVFRTYYFKTVYAPLKLKKLTRKNLLENLDGKSQEKNVKEFLKKYRIPKKDIITGRLLLLDL